MAERKRNEYRKEITILNKLLAFQNVICVYHSPEKIAGFSAAALKLVPGISSCSFCLYGHSKPFGDRNETADLLAAKLAEISGYRQDASMNLPSAESLNVYNLQSGRYFFGYVLISVADTERFGRFQSAVSNHLKIVALNLENQLQNDLLLKDEKVLESEVEKRTKELRDERSGHLQSQNALNESQDRYRELADTIPVGIYECDLKGEMIYANKTAMDWFGYSEEDLAAGISIYDCIISENHARARNNVRTISLTGDKSENEYTSKRKDGSVFHVNISSFPIYKYGKLSGLRGTISDITERKNAEIILRKSENHFRTLFEKSHEGIMYISTDGNIIRANDAITKILGLTEEELKMVMLSEGHLELSGETSHEMLMRITNGEDVNFEVCHPHKDGHPVILDVSASMVEIENEKIIIALIRDITSRKNIEFALQQKTGDLENLVGISNALITTLEFDDLLLKIVENAVKLHSLDTGALYLKRGEELYLCATAPALPPGVPDHFRIASINDHPRIKEALESGNPVTLADSSTEKFTPFEQEIVDALHLVSCIYVPILIQNRTIGMLILSASEKIKIFTDDEIRIYKLLSTQVGLVIENARLFGESKKYTVELEKKNRDLHFFGELSFELAEMPAEANISEFLIKKLLKYTGAIAGASARYDPDSGSLIPDRIFSEDTTLMRILSKQGKEYLKSGTRISTELYRNMLGEVALNGSVDSLSALDGIVFKAGGITNYSRITLSDSGKLIGSLMLAYKDGMKLPQPDLLASVGYIASVKIQRNRAERELRISETRLKEIIRNISDVISIIDNKGKIKFVSQNVEKVLGYPVSHYLGKSGFEFIFPEDVPLMTRLLDELISKPGQPVYTELRKICSDGSYKWVRGSAINLLDDPSINGILINFEDFDKIKKSEESLLKFRLGIERSPEAVFITDPEGLITYINPAFTKIYGYTREEAIGSTPRILKSGVYPEKVYLDFWSTLLSKQVIEGELLNRRKDGSTITIEGVNNPILNENGAIIGFLGIHHDISQRKSREEALRFSEERFRKAFMTNPDAVNINRLEDGLFMDVNDGFTNLTGYTRQEVIGRSSHDINIWADHEDRARMVKIIKETGTVLNLEAKFRMKDGTIKTGLMSASVIVFNDEPHIISITRDIEEIKKTQDALKESEDRFKQVTENAKEWIWEVDSKGKYTYASPVVQKILGYTPEELVGKKYFYDLFGPESRERVKKEALKVFKNKGKFYKFINKNINKKGEEIYLETTGAPILDNQGNLCGYLGADSDVTERILNEEKLRKLSLAVEQSPSSIIITNTKGEIEYVNNRFMELTGYSWDELSGNNPRVLKSGKTPLAEYKKLWEKVSSGNEWKGEFLNRKKNGEYFWEAASISPILDSNGKITHYLGIKEDITEKKEASKFIIDKIIETEEKERQRYSNELHDGLGPIISTIKLYFQLLNENVDVNQKKLIIARTETCIDEAILSLKEISHNLSPNVVNNFGLVTGIQSFINRLKETHIFKIDFKTNLEGRLERNVEVTLYRIVTEMINNTFKYACANRVSVNLNYNADESQVRLEYKDDGKGFDVDKTMMKGRGLGISSIHQRVSAMNGNSVLRSAPGKGVYLQVELNSILIKT
ncbi:MAG TPA: PAS domain S-box protein [Bacteroidales bacterium]|nr:PAS domain S-box protein [Bacteroidales bacterium]